MKILLHEKRSPFFLSLIFEPFLALLKKIVVYHKYYWIPFKKCVTFGTKNQTELVYYNAYFTITSKYLESSKSGSIDIWIWMDSKSAPPKTKIQHF